ncbi:VOC family protein [Streptomyces flavotricini]|uniref:VOC family protein n=1 Tax=Streptomyces flavotricini TaxID=66888 RepID=A0ABS8EGV4_9ACTN|nr:VOC family protein [Streptomyces flavotricini]
MACGRQSAVGSRQSSRRPGECPRPTTPQHALPHPRRPRPAPPASLRCTRRCLVDCHDPERLAAFWCEVLDFKVIDRSEGKVEIGSWMPTAEEVRARQMPPTLVFIDVPEGKTVKSRLHLDVSPIDGSTEEEVTRLPGLGAVKVDVGQGPDRNWVVMADPEGNEFDVLRTLAPHD